MGAKKKMEKPKNKDNLEVTATAKAKKKNGDDLNLYQLKCWLKLPS